MISKKEFLELPPEQARETLHKYIEVFGYPAIVKKWNLTKKTIRTYKYRGLYSYNTPKKLLQAPSPVAIKVLRTKLTIEHNDKETLIEGISTPQEIYEILKKYGNSYSFTAVKES